LAFVKKNKEELNTSKDLGNLHFLQPQAAQNGRQKYFPQPLEVAPCTPYLLIRSARICEMQAKSARGKSVGRLQKAIS
jgi:hypothetical protein